MALCDGDIDTKAEGEGHRGLETTRRWGVCVSRAEGKLTMGKTDSRLFKYSRLRMGGCQVLR
jgi:hypothetical protein